MLLGNPDDLAIHTIKDLRSKDKHGGTPRFTQLFSYARDQLIKHMYEEKLAEDEFKDFLIGARRRIKMPPVKDHNRKPETNFADLYASLMK